MDTIVKKVVKKEVKSVLENKVKPKVRSKVKETSQRKFARKSSGEKAMYDLTLDRRVSNRRDALQPTLEGMQYFDRRSSDNDRRQDNRPLNEFPFLPEVIL